MKNKILYSIILCGCAIAAVHASRKDEVTLLMVPREDGAMRVGMDIANRYPTLLLSYKVGNNGAVSLHGWSGKEWVNVELQNFHEGNFFKTGPDSALVIEVEGSPVPETLVPPEGWCGSAYKITTTDVRPLLHLVGQYYDFKYKEWSWFAENYRLPLDAINPEGLNVSWYHKRFNEHLKKQDAVIGDDLQYWVAVRHPQQGKIELAEASTNSTEQVDVEKQPDQEATEEPIINPLTNAVPEAIVLGAGTAEEAKIEPSEGSEKKE
ncbi:MAG: hypothetical protein V3V05_07195 [Pontiella sp.]